jgi:formylglycine-generating enzyme required for sulfatase activity
MTISARVLATALALAAFALTILEPTGVARAQRPAPESPIYKEKRVAFVVGIGGYQNAPKLANPQNDARRMAAALRDLNFEVDERIDPDFLTFTRALREFGIRAQTADAALIYYAGHGVQVDRVNYMLPVDARLERERDLLYQAVPLELMVGEAAGARKVGIVLLDACRNNPFSDRLSRGMTVAGRATGTAKGLARVDQVPSNTVVVLATKADQIAEDGSGENSPFTEAVLAHFKVKGLELSLFFRSVRDTVLRATGNRQEPYIFSSLGAEPWYFNPRPPNRPPELAPIAALEVADSAGPTPLALPKPTDPDQDELRVRVTGLPRGGEIRAGEKVVAVNDVLTLDRYAALTFKPDGSRTGKIGTFDFLVEDGRDGSALGVLPITVVASNRPPVVERPRKAVILPGALAIVQPTDPDGDPLLVTVTALPTRGLVRGPNGVVQVGDKLKPQDLPALVFAPDPGASGAIGAFRYKVEDGRGGAAEASVEIEIAKTDDASSLVSEQAVWARVRDSGSAADLDAFLRLFPGSRFADEARARRGPLVAKQEEVRSADARPAAAPPVPEAKPPSPGRSPTAAAGSSEPAMPPNPAATSPPKAEGKPPPKEADVQVAVATPPSGLAPKQPDGGAFQDCSGCPWMVTVPRGVFLMGSGSDDPWASPHHKVSIKQFALGRFPVTVAEFKECVEAGGCRSMPRMAVAEDRTPLHGVSWDDAQQYLLWLSNRTGKKYRLPTEAEWEYAARGNTTTRYWWGNEAGIGLANCSDCLPAQDTRAPMPVGSFKPNPFGLNDMLGGVAQWVEDCWLPNYQGAPADGSARELRNCSKRVLRGGSFRSDKTTIAAFARNSYDASVRYITNGFRVARDLD